ncbi:UNVERIFIED_CONTAM: TRAM domain-containing protein, partial [Salmonella enterica subsp. enterica serovar Weltevreden]
DEVKAERHARFMQVQQKISKARLKKKIGRTIEVLVDGVDEESGVLVGRSHADAPEIDGKVYLSTDRSLRAGQIVKARVIQASEYDLNAEVL